MPSPNHWTAREFSLHDIFIQIYIFILHAICTHLHLRFALGSIFIWLHLKACGILVPLLGIEPEPPVGEAGSLKHWTAREDPRAVLRIVMSTIAIPPSPPLPLSSPSSLPPSPFPREALLSTCSMLVAVSQLLQLWIIPRVLTIFLGTVERAFSVNAPPSCSPMTSCFVASVRNPT